MSIQTPQARYEFRKIRTRRKILGTAERPRLTVYRSSKHIYAQLVDDVKSHTLAAASTLAGKGGKKAATVETAKQVGKQIGEKAKALKVQSVVFDRGAFPYHGQIKAVAEGAREAGLQF
jgi:large subunit ribosomal protein L18